MIDEPFARGRSLVHGLDPRAKLVACLALSLAAALARGYLAPAAVLAFGALLVLAAHPPWRLLLGRLLAVNGFIAFLWLVIPVTAPGTALYRLGPFPVTAEGLRLAALITLKSNAVFACVLALVSTSTAPALSRAMTALHVPRKLSFLFLFTYRYLHVIAEEYGRIVTAARLRGFVPATDRRTYRTYAAILAMVLVRSFDRSARVYQAMLLRGFSGSFPVLATPAAGPRDAVFLAAALVAAVAAAGADMVWSGWHG
jgi:cobalt/nickel transport system permease protein